MRVIDHICFVITNSITSTVEEINETDTCQGPDVSLLLKSIETFEFLFSFMKQVLQRTNSLSLHFLKKKC